jgi:hypothetical protein
LRVLLAGLVVVYGLTLYLQWYWPDLSDLSVESRQYQQMVWATMSGLSLSYALQKLCLLLGNVVGALGIALLFFRVRSGLPMLLVSGPLLGAAALLGSPPAAFPDIEPITVTVFWCVSSAIWGCAVTYALVGKEILFSKQARGASSGRPVESMHPTS